MDTSLLPRGRCVVRVANRTAFRWCIWTGDRLYHLREVTLDGLLCLPLNQIRHVLESAFTDEVNVETAALLPPVETQEVWAAGVTYERSREARMEEAAVNKDVYARVYEAVRPELFFKAAGWRVIGSGGQVGFRGDSTWDVPEPELCVLSNAAGEVVGYACGNDMSSRSIEGENPLYLPQAKIYDKACAIGPALVPAWEVDVSDAAISMTIQREAKIVFVGEARTSQLVREGAALCQVLRSCYTLPVGAWLMTGTPVVPEPPYTAKAGDHVRITIDGLGTLSTTLIRVPHSGAAAPPQVR